MIRAVLDADVLYPLPLRDTLLSAGAAGCFQPLWSTAILDEVMRNLVKDGRATQDRADILRKIMLHSFEDALVEDYEPLIHAMPNHPKDRHVTACAVQGRASLIVTNNLRDFTPTPAGVSAVSPDDFLCLLLSVAPEPLAAALADQIDRLKNPPMTLDELLNRYAPVLPKFVTAWRDQ